MFCFCSLREVFFGIVLTRKFCGWFFILSSTNGRRTGGDLVYFRVGEGFGGGNLQVSGDFFGLVRRVTFINGGFWVLS